MLAGMRLSARVLDAEGFLGTTIDQTAAPASYHGALPRSAAGSKWFRNTAKGRHRGTLSSRLVQRV
jgi:hypothetical protein